MKSRPLKINTLVSIPMKRFIQNLAQLYRLTEYKCVLQREVKKNIGLRATAKPKILVSFTTTSFRIPYIDKAVNSFFNQSIKADEVFLFLSETPYLNDKGVFSRDIPASIRKKEKKGLIRIAYTKNTGPYRKLIPLLKEECGKDCVIITGDDDTVYPYDWIEALYTGYLNHPEKIAAHRCRLMWFQDRQLVSYRKWPLLLRGREEKSQDLQNEIKSEFRNLYIFPTDKGGVLYSYKFFSELVFDEIYLKLAPTNEDVWFKFMSLINNTGINLVKSRIKLHPNFGSTIAERIAPLQKINFVPGGNNNALIKNVINFLESKGLLDFQRHLKGWSVLWFAVLSTGL